jgi:hypothetical protein
LRIGPRALREPRAALSVAAVLAVLAAGCGGDGDDASTSADGDSEDVRVGSVAQLAQCSDWVAADDEERQATVEDIRSQINLQDAPVEIPALSDKQAMDLFDNACASDFAASFRLYKLYARAAGFQSFAPG